MRERQKPPFLTDDWMHEQQVRAELEAEAWRRMRQEQALPAPAMATPDPAAPMPTAPASIAPHPRGSAILKGLVRFVAGAVAGYIAYIAALDSQLGEFEAWLALAAAFIVTLALSMFGPMRRLVHVLAEAARWGLVGATALGAVWVFTQLLQ